MPLDDITRIYEAYLEEFHRKMKSRKAFDGVLGFRGRPQDFPCHEQFMQNLGEALKNLASQNPEPALAADVLRYVYCTAPAQWESESTVYWMLLAAHSLTLDLIASLDVPGAQALFDAYQKQFPRRQRLPIQIKVLNALKAQANAE